QERGSPSRTIQDIRELRRLVAGRATRLLAEHSPSADCRPSIEAVSRRLGRPQAQLIIEQSGELRRDEVRPLSDREAKPRIAEAAVSAHLTDADITVPVGDRSIAGEGLEPNPFQPKDGG